MASSTHRRLVVTKANGPFEIRKVQTPNPEKDQVLVKVKAAAFNPIDAKKSILGVNTPNWPSWPVVVGSEASGIVESVGPDVKGFKPGDEVLGNFGPNELAAAFQEYAAPISSNITIKPGSLSFEEAATLPIGFRTALTALYTSLDISIPFLRESVAKPNSPKSLLIIGGSSAVGAAAIQIARKVLPKATILTTASPSNHQHLLALGATKAIDRSAADLIPQIMAASPSGAGVEAVFDPVAAATTQHEYFSVLTGKTKIFSQLVTGKNVNPSEAPQGVDFRITTMTNLRSAPGGSNAIEALGNLLARGEWKPPNTATVVGHGMEAIEGGIRRLVNGVSGTKLVVTL